MEPDYVAGHSLGEYSALVAAGSLRFATPFNWCAGVGLYMQEGAVGVGAMAALLRLPEGNSTKCWPRRRRVKSCRRLISTRPTR